MNIKQKKLWIRYAKKFKLRSLEQVEQMEEILKQQFDYRKFYISEIGKQEYWTVKEKHGN